MSLHRVGNLGCVQSMPLATRRRSLRRLVRCAVASVSAAHSATLPVPFVDCAHRVQRCARHRQEVRCLGVISVRPPLAGVWRRRAGACVPTSRGRGRHTCVCVCRTSRPVLRASTSSRTPTQVLGHLLSHGGARHAPHPAVRPTAMAVERALRIIEPVRLRAEVVHGFGRGARCGASQWRMSLRRGACRQKG